VSRRDDIVAAARGIIEDEGADALTMRALADRLGIKAPSLYKHFRNKAEVEAAVVAQGLAEVGAAVSSTDGGLAGVARAYRAYALAHPNLYRLINDRPLPRHQLPEGLEDSAAAPLVAVTADGNQARAAWAFAHGMVTLELAGRFPADADLDAAWAAGVGAFSNGGAGG
jgi:AcrR family transcriptional regulator